MEGYHKKERFIVNVIFYCIIVGLLFVGCKYLLPVLMPFFDCVGGDITAQSIDSLGWPP